LPVCPLPLPVAPRVACLGWPGLLAGDAQPVGDGGGLDAAADTQLGEDVGDVHAGRLGADEQLPGDLRVGAAGRDEHQDLALAVGEAEARQLIGRPGRRRRALGGGSRLSTRVLCGTGPAGYLYPSQVADHFMDRREADWERWLPAWACDCGRAFKVAPGWPGTTFYEASPDGRAGSLAGHVTPDSSRRQVKHSGACPGCGRLFADTIARYPVTPRPSKPAPPPEQLPGLF